MVDPMAYPTALTMAQRKAPRMAVPMVLQEALRMAQPKGFRMPMA
jgi:hypothetical protein